MMKKNIFAFFRTMMLVAMIPVLSLSLVACEPEGDELGADPDSPEETLYEAVDLGLSVKWATCNVGAESPEEYGAFYAWGEIASKIDYSESTYWYYANGAYEYIGEDICGTEYDVAHLEMGGNWRMPTRAEVKELYENCTWEWTEVNGVSGEKIIGPNGNSIFLPAAGYRESNRHCYPGTFGYYSSGTLSSNDKERAFCFAFRDGARLTSYSYRYGGQAIRPVLGNVSISPHYIIKVLSPLCNISYKADAIDVELKANVDVKYQIIDASWVREQAETRALTTHKFIFEVDENDTRDTREAHILFYNSESAVSDTLTLVQEGNPDAMLKGAVDLGLSVYWASCNVGAEVPEEYGDYFAWGGTYVGSDCVTYGLFASELKSRGIIDSDGNLTAAYDAATVNCGSDWRMPTSDEIKELINNCTWEWTSVNGVNGRLVTGPNGNSIFLPAAGDCLISAALNDAGSDGSYWSATFYHYSDLAGLLDFNSDEYNVGNGSRFVGRTVRPVTDK